VALKDWFRGRGKEDAAQYTVDDLIALERFGEAEARLRTRLSISPRDLHARLKLADLLVRTSRSPEALDEYLVVADEYGRDGFYDKAHALLEKVGKLVPFDEKIRQKMKALDRAKKLERRREVVVEGILAAGWKGGKVSPVELRRLLWDLASSPLFDRLNEGQLRRLFREMTIERLRPDDPLVGKGESREEIYLIAQGSIAVKTVLQNGQETVLRTFGAGDLIGDRALLEHRPWAADYQVEDRSALFKLDREGLEQVLTGEADPRGLLDALRIQRHDHTVASKVLSLSRSS